MDGKLRKIPAAGGQSETICEVWTVFGGAWSRSGEIVYSSGVKGLYRVPASGGLPVQIPPPKKGLGYYRYPSFLPDGRHFLVSSGNGPGGIFVASVDTGQLQPVLPSESGAARYAEPGYVLFLHGDSLMAQRFDAKTQRTSGTAQRIAESVYDSPNSFSAASSGLLLYQHAFQTQLTWIDPAGEKLSTLGSPGYLSSPYLSADGKYAVGTVTDPRQNQLKLWPYDIGRGTANPFTFGDGDDQFPAWPPESQQVAFSSTRGGKEEIYVKPVGGGSREQKLLSLEGGAETDRWSSDGRFLLFDYFGSEAGGGDVWALPLFG